MFSVIPAIPLAHGRLAIPAEDIALPELRSRNPLVVAQYWFQQGAQSIHVESLDPEPCHSTIPAFLLGCRQRTVTLQVGGGVLTPSVAKSLLGTGATLLVVRTLIRHPDQLTRFISQVGAEHIVVSWHTLEEMADHIEWLPELGVYRALLPGFHSESFSTYCRLAERLVSHGWQVSLAGNLQSLDDLRRVRNAGVTQAIVGRALYRGHIALRDAI